MRIVILLCLTFIVVAKKHRKLSDEYLARQALDQLTFTREEQIYNIALDLPHESQDGSRAENDVTNVCSFYKCGEGKTCIVTEDNDPTCTCVDTCRPAREALDHICSSSNVTYDSECEFYRRKCVGELPEEEGLHYYGECKALTPCPVSELNEFPQRLRNWFTDVMLSLANLDGHLGGLSEADKQLARDSVLDEHPYVKPVHWKFRSLDCRPQDSFLSQEELVPLRAALIPLEHCASVFFAMCDSDQDSRLNRNEWGNCMGLSPEELEE